jgi:hypothetical protein
VAPPDAGPHIDAVHVLDDWRWKGRQLPAPCPEEALVVRKDHADTLAQASSFSGVGEIHDGERRSGDRVVAKSAPKGAPHRNRSC